MSESSTNKKPKMEDFEFPNDLTGEKAYNAYRKAKKEWREKREKEKGSKISENRNPPKKKDSFEDEINSAELKLEHLADQDFIKSICNGEVRYDIDNQEGNDKESWDVWIEFENVKPEALEELDKDYNKFAAPFVKWAKENDLYNPSILSTDDTISFKITLL
jgi:2-oxoglutarate dehydrogenase complex dehydrogenase (E1) component-like enzyme